MEFKDFCIIVLGKVIGVKDEIRSISELEINFVEHKNIVIATFSTVATVSEMKEFFTANNRGFFLFEIGDDNYAADLGSDKIYNALFKNFEDSLHRAEEETNLDFIIKLISNELGANPDKFNVSGNTTPDISISEPIAVKHKISESICVDKLNKEEKQILINEIIDKGYENFTTDDKDLLSKLTKE